MATRGLPLWPQTDGAVDELPEAERLLLDAARAWAAPGPGGPVAQAALVLASHGAEGLALVLDAALRPLSGLRLGCPLCPLLTAEESALLAATLAARAGPGRGVALALLQSLAPPLPAYRAMPALIGLGCGLTRAGLRLGSAAR